MPGPESLITQVQQPGSESPITSVQPRRGSSGDDGTGGIITSVSPTTGGGRSQRSSGGKVDRGDQHELVATKGGEKGSKPIIVRSAVAQGGAGVGGGGKRMPEKKWLLKPLTPEDAGKKCLVLDLDETLVHSSFKAVPNADFIIPVEIDGQIHNVYVLKRPGVDVFLQRLGRQFEVVVFTASLAKYADPVLDMLDKHRVVKHRLFRESCLHHKGNYVKDLSQLGRDLKDVIILDNSPASYIFHPTNAIPISSWFNDPNDTELMDLIPFLEDLKLVENVMSVLSNDGSD
ncbi:hypothetical protein HDU67_001640 [Dinochytrium kinnereticum]|nr:hypothetical protein HDU67_001640 [Dinochytrium kinnereticum]